MEELFSEEGEAPHNAVPNVPVAENQAWLPRGISLQQKHLGKNANDFSTVDRSAVADNAKDMNSSQCTDDGGGGVADDVRLETQMFGRATPVAVTVQHPHAEETDDEACDDSEVEEHSMLTGNTAFQKFPTIAVNALANTGTLDGEFEFSARDDEAEKIVMVQAEVPVFGRSETSKSGQVLANDAPTQVFPCAIHFNEESQVAGNAPLIESRATQVLGHVAHFEIDATGVVEDEAPCDMVAAQGDVAPSDIEATQVVGVEAPSDMDATQVVGNVAVFDMDATEVVRVVAPSGMEATQVVGIAPHSNVDTSQVVGGVASSDVDTTQVVRDGVHFDIDANQGVSDAASCGVDTANAVEGVVFSDMEATQIISDLVHPDLYSVKVIDAKCSDLSADEASQVSENALPIEAHITQVLGDVAHSELDVLEMVEGKNPDMDVTQIVLKDVAPSDMDPAQGDVAPSDMDATQVVGNDMDATQIVGNDMDATQVVGDVAAFDMDATQVIGIVAPSSMEATQVDGDVDTFDMDTTQVVRDVVLFDIDVNHGVSYSASTGVDTPQVVDDVVSTDIEATQVIGDIDHSDLDPTEVNDSNCSDLNATQVIEITAQKKFSGESSCNVSTLVMSSEAHTDLDATQVISDIHYSEMDATQVTEISTKKKSHERPPCGKEAPQVDGSSNVHSLPSISVVQSPVIPGVKKGKKVPSSSVDFTMLGEVAVRETQTILVTGAPVKPEKSEEALHKDYPETLLEDEAREPLHLKMDVSGSSEPAVCDAFFLNI